MNVDVAMGYGEQFGPDDEGKFDHAWSPAFPARRPDVDSAGLECPAQTPQKAIHLRVDRRKDAKQDRQELSRH